jgi:hypothetical protein
MQENFVIRRNFVEATERNLTSLVELLKVATQDVDSLRRNANNNVNATTTAGTKK